MFKATTVNTGLSLNTPTFHHNMKEILDYTDIYTKATYLSP